MAEIGCSDPPLLMPPLVAGAGVGWLVGIRAFSGYLAGILWVALVDIAILFVEKVRL